MKSKFLRTSGFFLATILISTNGLRAQAEIGELSGSMSLTVGDGSTNLENPAYKIAGISLSQDPVYTGATASATWNAGSKTGVVTLATEEDIEGNTVPAFPTDHLASGTVLVTATVNGSGAISGFTVVSGGSGLGSTEPTVVIDDPDTGDDAATVDAAQITLSGGAVTGMTPTNAGSGYSSANPPGVTVDSGRHFIRLTSGAHEGRAFLIDSNTATSVTIGDTSLGEGEALTDLFSSTGLDNVEIVRATTLGEVFGTTAADVDLTGGDFPDTADWVYLWEPSSSGGVYIPYYFNTGGGVFDEGWFKVFEFFLVSPRNDTLIYPDESFIVARRNDNALNLSFDGALLTTDTQMQLPRAGQRFLMNNPFGADILLTELLPSDSIGQNVGKFYPHDTEGSGDLVYVLESDGTWSKYFHKNSNVAITEVATCTAIRLSGTGVASADISYPVDPNNLVGGHKCTISSITNPAPGDANMTITTGANHGLVVGDIVTIAGVKGYKYNDDNSKYLKANGDETSVQGEALVIETSANGTWPVISKTNNTFTIAKSANAEYMSGGYWATGTGGAGYSGTAAVYFIGGGGSGGKGTCTITAGKVSAISISSAGSGYTSTPQAIFSSGQWRESNDPFADVGNTTINAGAGILIKRNKDNSGETTYLKAYNPVK